MDKERKQDLSDPQESELERRIDEMLDPNIPDKSETPEPTVPEVKTEVKAKKIAIIHHDEAPLGEPEAPSAPPVPSKSTTKKSVKIAVAHDDETDKEKEDLAKAIEAANSELASKVQGDTPPLPDPAAIEEAAKAETKPEPAPVVPLVAPKKQVPITIADAEEAKDEASVKPADSVVEDPVPASPDETLSEDPELPDNYTDQSTSDAVDDIVAEEGDQLLAMQDTEASAPDKSEPQKSEKQTPKEPSEHRIRAFFSHMWHSRLARWAFVLLIIVVLAGAAVLPTTRYYALNTAGVRSSASVKITDQSTFQPLKNVKVQLAGQTATTGTDGVAHFKELRLGPTLLTVQKVAFAPITDHVTVGWGSNPLGDRSLKPTGNQYAFVITDFLSGKPIPKAEATMDQADAIADDKGKLRLTLDHRTDGATEVKITANGYRQETVALEFSSANETAVKLVPARKEVFITKRSGKYDVYKIDIDAKNEELVLAATGHEQDSITLVPNTTDEVTALVSTRDNLRNKDGFLLSTLTFINLADNAKKTIAQSEQFRIVGWAGERLVYVQIAAGTSAASPSRVRLMSYNYKTQENKQLASSNYFNDVMLVNGKIYYAPSSTYQPAGLQVAFYSISPDGNGKQTILGTETWNAFRTSYDHIVLSVPNQWYDYTVGTTPPAKLDAQPANLSSRVYVDSPDGKRSLWVDKRDGKGVLVAYDVQAKTERVLQTQSGLVLPVRWINNSTLIYRIHTDQETADYALNVDGGEPRKIIDVTNTSGVDKWYYY